MLEPVNKLGTFCRKKRLEMGLTLREASERSGLSYTQIASIERGDCGERAEIRLSTFIRLAGLYGIDPGRFTAGVIIALDSEDNPEDRRSLEDILAGLRIRQRVVEKASLAPSR